MCTRLAKDVRNVHAVYLKPALRLSIAQRYPGTRMYVHVAIYILDREHVEFDRWGSLTLAPIICFFMGYCVLCLGGRICCLRVGKEVGFGTT